MAAWSFTGGEIEGTILGPGGERYPCRLEHGQVQVVLPFAVNQGRLRKLLQDDGWAVSQNPETVDSVGWGPSYVMDGYYPFWLRTAPGEGGSLLAFPPQEYKVGPGSVAGPESAAHLADQEALAAKAEPSPDRRATGWKKPLIASQALEQFARWLPYLKKAAGRPS